MVRLKVTKAERKEENLVPLINIVFLILIFFLVAATIRPFTDRDVRLVETSEASGSGGAPQMVILRRSGETLIAGSIVSNDELHDIFNRWQQDGIEALTVVADKEMPASLLISVVTMANSAGLKDIKLLTKKAR